MFMNLRMVLAKKRYSRYQKW